MDPTPFSPLQSMGDKEITAEAPPPAAADDTGEETRCTDHPYRNNPGGICAFCLQEKLGKLVSSSSSSSPPFPSLPPQPPSPPFPSSSIAPVQHRADQTISGSSSGGSASSSSNVSALSRSKSVAPATADGPRKKSFWSFLHLNSSSSTNKRRSTPSVAGESAGSRDPKQNEEKPNAKARGPEAESHVPSSSSSSSSSVSRKVARSRSVGCGSRSFSGDFLERISTGFGDCALRRVESHREPNRKISIHRRRGHNHNCEQRIEGGAKCGGIFGGFGTISPSSSAYWLSAAASSAAARDRGDDFDTGRSNTSASMVLDSRSRNRSWAWAFASPMRAFKPATASRSYGPRNNAVRNSRGIVQTPNNW